MIFITKRTGRASLRVGAADKAIHVYHHLKVFWIASCCVPRSRNDDAWVVMMVQAAQVLFNNEKRLC
jgi:hypothetical protein